MLRLPFRLGGAQEWQGLGLAMSLVRYSTTCLWSRSWPGRGGEEPPIFVSIVPALRGREGP